MRAAHTWHAETQGLGPTQNNLQLSFAFFDYARTGDQRSVLAIVQHNSMPGYFQVKSRTIEPLEILWPEHQVEIIDWADYRFRITMAKEQVIPVVMEQLSNVDYTSFKDQCLNDEDYYYTLTRVWSVMYDYQQRMES